MNKVQLSQCLQNTESSVFFGLARYLANRLPREQEIVSALSFKPKMLQRKSIIERVADKIKAFIEGKCLMNAVPWNTFTSENR
ncbi:hypothetical protein METHB2_30030 [Candidatus Methylobacter favarea]|uniref:Uncharacterized protein n=1 Tax=Candidatus Methylobacter favarea TaxID=2707345 RepID=A0A8S0XIJ5_9GAMM|nr:hypothetical protein METHB2_30030 [Candidatus Methylobacter favarea]